MTAQIESTFNMVAGFGFRANATVASLRSALEAANATQPTPLLTALATAQDKAMHPAILELAKELALPLQAVALAQLTSTTTTASMTFSHHIPERYGARSVAESSALAAAGLGAQLLAPRAISADKMATAALAVAPSHIHLSPTPPP